MLYIFCFHVDFANLCMRMRLHVRLVLLFHEYKDECIYQLPLAPNGDAPPSLATSHMGGSVGSAEASLQCPALLIRADFGIVTQEAER